MVYSYWKCKKHETDAVFSAYFRKNPFEKQFTVFAGLGRFIEYLENFKITKDDIHSIKKLFNDEFEEEFYEYLLQMDLRSLEVYAIEEGSIVFPCVPLIQLCGPLAVLQLLETILLNLTNFASLVATNAAHFRIAAGKNTKLMEFGCRRAQGPDGALSSSLYSYIGGFDGTSNVEAAVLFGIPASGTVGHSFVSSFANKSIRKNDKGEEPLHALLEKSLEKLNELHTKEIICKSECWPTELEAFVSFAQSFSDNFLAIIDTYNILGSGLPNFCAVALALNDFGHKAVGIRLDSGDLAYFSIQCREVFKKISESYNIPWFRKLTIIASNEINIEGIYSMIAEKHEIDVFGIGTNLVTCTSQPSLGMVYKLVELAKQPAFKITEDVRKISIPYKKKCYRLYNADGIAILDYLTLWNEEAPKVNEKIVCYHPHLAGVKVQVVATFVKLLSKLVFCNETPTEESKNIEEIKAGHIADLQTIRYDYLRYINPTAYKISVSKSLLNAFDECKESFPLVEIH